MARARENGPYIVSARRQALLVFAVGLLGAQLGWDETEWARAADVFGNVEKILAVAAAVGDADAWQPRAEQRGLRVGEVLGGGERWQSLVAAMAGPERGVVELALASGGAGLATALDPANRCGVDVFAIEDGDDPAGEGVALEVRGTSAARTPARAKAAFGDVFVAKFRGHCPPVLRRWGTFAVASYGGGSRAVVLEERLHEPLGLTWLRRGTPSRTGARPRRERLPDGWAPYLSPAQFGRLEQFSEPFVRAVDVMLLQERIVREARSVSGRSFALGEWREAARSVADGRSGPAGLWGFRFERRLAAWVAPAVLLGLCVSFVYSVRRIDPRGDVLAEPWLAVMPRGWVERLGAAGWMLGTFAAVGGVGWAIWAYDWSDRWVYALVEETTADDEAGFGTVLWITARRPGMWGVGLLVLAAAALVRGWWHVCRLGWRTPERGARGRVLG